MRVALEKPGTPEELVHFGVKGMKWGVRKQRVSNPELKSRAKKILAEKKSPLIEVRLKQMMDLSPLQTKDYERLSTRPVHVPAGKTMYRLTQDPNDTKLSGYSFVTTNKKDAEIYRGLLPSQRLFDPLRKSDYKQHHEIVFNTKKTLRGPSEKERFDILRDLVDNKTAIDGKRSLREYYRKTGVLTRKEARNDSAHDIALKVHRRVHQEMWNRKNKVSQAYVNEVKRRGYDIISDDNDSGVISKRPMIVLDPLRSTEVKQVTALSNDDILNAQINLTFPVKKAA